MSIVNIKSLINNSNMVASGRESEVLEFVDKYIQKCGYSPTDQEIAFEFEFSLSRASAIIKNLQYKGRIFCGPPRRIVKVL